MNREAVKTEIQNIISENRKAIRYARQYKPAKHQLATLTTLSIVDLMPEDFGHSDAKAVIEAAQDEGKWVGDFDQVEKMAASKLYTLLNTVEVMDLAAKNEVIEESDEDDYSNYDRDELDDLIDEVSVLENEKYIAEQIALEAKREEAAHIGQRVNIYETADMRHNLKLLFNRMKTNGDIARNEVDEAKHRAKIIAYALRLAVEAKAALMSGLG
jgi:hypothetical protein